MKFPSIIVESDAVGVIKMLNGEEEDLSEVAFLAAEISLAKSSFEDIRFVHAPRAPWM